LIKNHDLLFPKTIIPIINNIAYPSLGNIIKIGLSGKNVSKYNDLIGKMYRTYKK